MQFIFSRFACKVDYKMRRVGKEREGRREEEEDGGEGGDLSTGKKAVNMLRVGKRE
jgi:hypothetical protein